MPNDASKRSLNVIVFPGVQNLPHFAAEQQNFYTRRNLQIDLTFTHSSLEQREGLAKGTYQIAHAAIDNAVAMVDVAGEDIEIVIGLDMAFNKLVSAPHLRTYEDLRGKVLGVDAPDTAFALVAFEMLRRNGLHSGDYEILPVGATSYRLDALKSGKIDFTMLNLPFNLFAKQAGLHFLDDPFQIIGPYQSMGGFINRKWGASSETILIDYLSAYIEGVRWVLTPANRKAATALLSERMSLTHDVAALCLEQICDPVLGFRPDAALDIPGMEKVLSLRANFRGLQDHPPIGKYYGGQFYQRALTSLQQ